MTDSMNDNMKDVSHVEDFSPPHSKLNKTVKNADAATVMNVNIHAMMLTHQGTKQRRVFVEESEVVTQSTVGCDLQIGSGGDVLFRIDLDFFSPPSYVDMEYDFDSPSVAERGQT
jgi:CO dehydrogenase/acetyl-CoA synthase gamma subunit (corrinoid Fe-S protein)